MACIKGIERLTDILVDLQAQSSIKETADYLSKILNLNTFIYDIFKRNGVTIKNIAHFDDSTRYMIYLEFSSRFHKLWLIFAFKLYRVNLTL